MARAIWTGSVSFGLVNVPVGLYSATEDHDVHFHQFEKGTTARVRNQRVNEKTGDEVAYKDVVKGAELSDGGYVMITQEELESVEPTKSRTIDISDFVDAAEIDPIYYQKSYYLAPSDDSAKKAYTLLVKAMDDAQRIGVATFVMRGKQYLCAIRPSGNVLVLETMYFADEVRDPAQELDQLPTRSKVGGKDLKTAVNLVKAMTTPWDPKNYRDTYTERVEKLIQAKKKDREIVIPEDTEAEADEVVDLRGGHDHHAVRHGDDEQPRPLPPGHGRHRPGPLAGLARRGAAPGDGRPAAPGSRLDPRPRRGPARGRRVVLGGRPAGAWLLALDHGRTGQPRRPGLTVTPAGRGPAGRSRAPRRSAPRARRPDSPRCRSVGDRRCRPR